MEKLLCLIYKLKDSGPSSAIISELAPLDDHVKRREGMNEKWYIINKLLYMTYLFGKLSLAKVFFNENGLQLGSRSAAVESMLEVGEILTRLSRIVLLIQHLLEHPL